MNLIGNLDSNDIASLQDQNIQFREEKILFNEIHDNDQRAVFNCHLLLLS